MSTRCSAYSNAELFTFLIQSGDQIRIDYKFPFEKEWAQFDYLFQDGANTKAITEIVLPEGICQLDDYAYSDSKYLTKVTLPKSIRKIGTLVFSGCIRNLKIYYPYN